MKENVLERMERIGAKDKMAAFQVKMQMPYDFKVKYARRRAEEFAEECGRRGLTITSASAGLTVSRSSCSCGRSASTHRASA